MRLGNLVIQAEEEGTGENFNKTIESKEPGAAVVSFWSLCLVNLKGSLPRAGENVLVQRQKLL